jgi:hypothetical protein
VGRRLAAEGHEALVQYMSGSGVSSDNVPKQSLGVIKMLEWLEQHDENIIIPPAQNAGKAIQ